MLPHQSVWFLLYHAVLGSSKTLKRARAAGRGCGCLLKLHWLSLREPKVVRSFQLRVGACREVEDMLKYNRRWESSSGRMADSGSASPGSNPGLPALLKRVLPGSPDEKRDWWAIGGHSRRNGVGLCPAPLSCIDGGVQVPRAEDQGYKGRSLLETGCPASEGERALRAEFSPWRGLGPPQPGASSSGRRLSLQAKRGEGAPWWLGDAFCGECERDRPEEGGRDGRDSQDST